MKQSFQGGKSERNYLVLCICVIWEVLFLKQKTKQNKRKSKTKQNRKKKKQQEEEKKGVPFDNTERCLAFRFATRGTFVLC